MISAETLRYELEGRVAEAASSLGKTHLSVRWEPAPRIARVGWMLDHYDWDSRMEAIRLLRRFEREHTDEFAIEYDVVPLEPVLDEAYAEA